MQEMQWGGGGLTGGRAAHGALVEVVAQGEHGLQQHHEVTAGRQLVARATQDPQIVPHLNRGNPSCQRMPSNILTHRL